MNIAITPDRLVLTHFPWSTLLVLAAVVGFALWSATRLARRGQAQNARRVFGLAVLAPLIVGGVLIARDRLVLDAAEGTATLGRIALTGGGVTTRPLASLLRAETEERAPGDNRGRRVVLVFEDGPLPLTTGYQNGEGPGRAAEAVNAWLAGLRD